MELKNLRDKIDEIDEALLRLFEARMDVVSEIAVYKRKNGLPAKDKAREAEILEALSGKVRPELAPYVPILYDTLFKLAYSHQEKQGIEVI